VVFRDCPLFVISILKLTMVMIMAKAKVELTKDVIDENEYVTYKNADGDELVVILDSDEDKSYRYIGWERV
jgi:hypothetical protein